MEVLIMILGLMPQLAVTRVEEATELHKYVSIKRGASIKEALMAYGMPEDAKESVVGKPYLQLFYSGPLCVYENLPCYIVIENNEVTEFAKIKPKYRGF